MPVSNMFRWCVSFVKIFHGWSQGGSLNLVCFLMQCLKNGVLGCLVVAVEVGLLECGFS